MNTWSKSSKICQRYMMNEKRDRMYAGDLLKWRAFTKALYCRFLIRQLPNWNNTPETCQKIIKAGDDVLMDGNWAEPL